MIATIYEHLSDMTLFMYLNLDIMTPSSFFFLDLTIPAFSTIVNCAVPNVSLGQEKIDTGWDNLYKSVLLVQSRQSEKKDKRIYRSVYKKEAEDLSSGKIF